MMNKMYQFVFLLTLLFVLQSPLFSQKTFGVKGGLSLADINVKSNNLLVNKAYQYASAPLWHLGVTESFTIHKRFSIQPELLLTQKGAQRTFESLTLPEHTYKYKMLYLSLPVLLQYRIGPITLEAGSEIGYMLTNKTFIDGERVNSTFSIFGDKKLDMSTNIGFKFTIKNFFTQVRWQYSFLSVANVQFTDVNGAFIGNYDYYHNTISVSLGYLLTELIPD